MNIFEFVCVSVITFVCGIICTLALEFYLFKRYLEEAPQATPPKRPIQHGKAQLPKELLEKIQDEKTSTATGMARQGM